MSTLLTLLGGLLLLIVTYAVTTALGHLGYRTREHDGV